MLKTISISFPPYLKEQQKLIGELDAVAEKTQRLASLYQKLAALDELKQSLLHQAFSGAL